ncbi:MAG TPA: hypothetical protein VIU11_21070 [Nakamurella sp.]
MEYWLPRNGTQAWLLTVCPASTTAPHGAGIARSGSTSARSPTVVRCP